MTSQLRSGVLKHLFAGMYTEYEKWAFLVTESEMRVIFTIACSLVDQEIPKEPVGIAELIHFVKADGFIDSRSLRRVKGYWTVDIVDANNSLFGETTSFTKGLGSFATASPSEKELEVIEAAVTWFTNSIFGLECYTGLLSLIWSMENESQVALLFGLTPDEPQPKIQVDQWRQRFAAAAGEVR